MGPLALSAHRQFTRIGVRRYFFFATFRLALLRPSYRGRRAGVDSLRFLRFLMVSPLFVVKGRTRSAREGSVDFVHARIVGKLERQGETRARRWQNVSRPAYAGHGGIGRLTRLMHAMYAL